MCTGTQSRQQESHGQSEVESNLQARRAEHEKPPAHGQTSEERSQPGMEHNGSVVELPPASFLARKFDALRMEHFQLFAIAVVTCFASKLLLPLLTQPSIQDGGHPADVDSEAAGVVNGMLHLGSFGANFGAQMWVTFVAGLTMFYSLPRHMFGKVQSLLFPMFYLWSLVCSAVTLSTFLDRHPYNTWDSTYRVRAFILAICFLTAAINSLVVSPAIVAAMLQTFKKEVEAGVGHLIGHANVLKLKSDPEYCKSYRTFRRFHGLSAMMVVTSLVCNMVYLYHVTSDCTAVL